MKKTFAVLLVCALLAGMLGGCSPFDDSYGSSVKTSEPVIEKKYENIKIPEIKSDDEIMPTFIDISLYDEENYADIYLGEDYEYSFTYGGAQLSVPTSYKKMTKAGWTILEGEYGLNSIIRAGKSAKANFVNEYNKQITAVFYNSSNSSVELRKSTIVKLIVPENCIYNSESVYGQFWINGVSNESAITDVIEYLGNPSHFYSVSEDEYYLDYFLFEKDKRSGITVYISPKDDCIKSVEIAYYK